MNRHIPGEQRLYSPAGENQLRYCLYLPPKFNDMRDKRWPVLCFLHGAGEAAKAADGTDQSIEVIMNHGTPPWHCAINSPMMQEFIVFSPQLPIRRSWERRDLEEVYQHLKIIYENFRGSREQTYLTGFSVGARAVFDFAGWGRALRGREEEEVVHWAALWPVDDASNQARNSCDIERVWLCFGTWRPDCQYSTAKNLALQNAMAFRNGHPEADRLYADYTPFNYNHTATCVAAYSDWRVYRWLLRSHVGGPQNYV